MNQQRYPVESVVLQNQEANLQELNEVYHQMAMEKDRRVINLEKKIIALWSVFQINLNLMTFVS